MASETVWLRAAYTARARLPRKRMTAWPVSEMVPVEIPVVDLDDHPVALRVTRPLGYVASDDAQFHGNRVAGRAVPVVYGEPRTFELRHGPDGALAPVLAPDGSTVTALADLSLLTDMVGSEAGRGHHAVTWEAYPGTTRTWATNQDLHRWPAPRTDSPMRPVWDCPDVAAMGFAEMDEETRDGALAAFRSRVAGLRVMGGRLWTTCGTPVVATTLGAGMTRDTHLLVPGMDPSPVSEVRMPGYAAIVDYRSHLPEAADVERAGFAVETLSDLPRADLAGSNLLTLPRHVRAALDSAMFVDVPGRALPLLGWVDEVGAMIASGRDLAELEAEAGDLIRQTVGRMRDDGTRRWERFDPLLRRLAEWPAIVEAERAAILASGDEPEADALEGLRI